jgi:hypothetical protein
MGCLVELFIWPFRIIRWCFTNGWKGLIVGLVLASAITVFVVVGINKFSPAKTNTGKTTTTTQVITGLPDKKAAPFLVTTNTRFYYAEKATKDKAGTVTLQNYWELMGNQWVQRTSLVLGHEFGEVKIQRR